MFAREYLTIVSRWARRQLRTEVHSAADRRRLRQLIEAAEALSASMRLPAVGEGPENVVRLADHRPRQRAPKKTAAEKMIQFLDP
ncbi:MAG: hypothetical protein IT547_11860 [Hyphomonadaceae bacterium]|nr:hypothetical protein [Hyphomonadaceae bacterium]